MVPEDHQRCFQAALVVLTNDARSGINLGLLDAGVINQALYDADWGGGAIPTPLGDVPINGALHYLNPYTHQGIGMGLSIFGGLVTNAALYCQICFDAARTLWPSHRQLATRLFGIALHLVQDLTVPHHANCAVLRNHQGYEAWLNVNWSGNVPINGGEYDRNRYASVWVYENARRSFGLIGYCDGINPIFAWNPWLISPRDDNRRVRDAMIPLAIRTSAGFIDSFLALVS